MIDPNTADMIAVGTGLFGTGIVTKIVWDWLKSDHGGNGKKYLTREMHDIICNSICMKFQNHVNVEISKLKDSYLDQKFKEIFEILNSMRK